MKRILSATLGLLILIASCTAVFALEPGEKEFDGYVYFTVERLTLNQGLIVEPVKVGYYQDESLGEIAQRALGDKSTYEGDVSNYYLEGVVDGGEPVGWTTDDIPVDISNAVTAEGAVFGGRATENTLSAYDYTSWSGWIFTVDNHGLNSGAGSIEYGEDTSDGNHYGNGSVIRLQYSVYGYGEDIGISWGFFSFDTANTFADRSRLIRAVADVNEAGTAKRYGGAYKEATELLNSWNVTEEEVNSAAEKLAPIEESPHCVEWAGAMNCSQKGNGVTDVPIAIEDPVEKWSYALNKKAPSWGVYYAGQTVIVDDYLYATGGGSLHKINTKTGEGKEVNAAGSSSFSYDYLCYGDGMIFVATAEKIEAFDIDTLQSVASVSGSFGGYHPIQFNNGYLTCNGYIFKVDMNSPDIITQVGEDKIDGAVFGWSQGVFLGEYFYAVGSNKIYCVDIDSNSVVDSLEVLANKTITGQLVYDNESGYIYWASYQSNNIQAVKINGDGKFDADSYTASDINQKSVCAPVVYKNRIYVAGQSGSVTVINGDSASENFLSVIYETDSIGKIQSNPILTTAYERETGSVYLYVQSYNVPGNIYYLEDNQNKVRGELTRLTDLSTTDKSAYAFEQIAVDNEGSVYFYNEEGYLYCWGESVSHIYAYKTNGDGTHIKHCTEDNCHYSVTRNCVFIDNECICGCKVQEGVYGDVNTDGEVNVDDAVLIQKHIANIKMMTEEQKYFASFDDDISVRAATKIQKFAAKFTINSKVGEAVSRYF